MHSNGIMVAQTKKIKVYISPNPYEKNQVYNPYVANIFNSFNNTENVENVYGRGIHCLGFLNLILYVHCDVIVLSWPENLAFARFRFLYIPYFVFCILLMRLFNKKIVWILHNKHPHAGENKLSTFIMNFLARVCTLSITHSKEGIEFFQKNLFNRPKCFYIPHPVYTDKIKASNDIKWDYIIWGEIQKRKGIVEFLNYIKEDSFYNDKKILICGRCDDTEYNKEIESALSPNVTYINRFIEDAELDEFIRCSKTILFTYNSTSVLCSGALIFSLNYCKPIIAPSSGSFSEMPGIVSCYSSFDEIKDIIYTDNKDLINDYIKNNTWSSFADKVLKLLTINV